MSAISEWASIIHKAEQIRQMAARKEWIDIPDVADELDRNLRFFFENQIADLSLDEQVSIKEQGGELVALITQIQQQLVLAKQEASQQAGRMAKGRKGISAYKKA